jgi:hypothetical protein
VPLDQRAGQTQGLILIPSCAGVELSHQHDYTWLLLHSKGISRKKV